MDRESLIKTVSRITELRSEIARLVELQRELKRLESLLDEIEGVDPSPRAVRAKGTTIEDQVCQFLEEHGERDWSADEVAQQLGLKIPTTRAAFSKLRKTPARIIDTARGRVRTTKVVPAMRQPTEEHQEEPRDQAA